MEKKLNKIHALLCALILAFTCIQPSTIHAEENKSEPQMICITKEDTDPLSTIKTKMIEAQYEDTSSIDIEQSTISIHEFQKEHGLFLINAQVQLASTEETTAPLGYAFNKQILLSIEPSFTPEFILESETINLKLNDEFNPMDYVAYLNNETQPTTIRVDHNVDTTTPGYYQATYTASNMANQSKTQTITVHVIKPLSGPRLISLEECHINDDGSIEAMFQAINAVREANGLHPYIYGDTLMQKAAAIRAEEASMHIGHYRPDGSYYPSVFEQLGINVSASEILVAYGDSVQTNLNWWLNEPLHAAIVLDQNFTHIVLGHHGSVWSGEAY